MNLCILVSRFSDIAEEYFCIQISFQKNIIIALKKNQDLFVWDILHFIGNLKHVVKYFAVMCKIL